MFKSKRTLWMTGNALFTALFVVVQLSTNIISNNILKGSIINFLLIVCVMICGLSSGIFVSVMSPIIAKLFGIGHMWSMLPFIMLGNIALVLIWHYVGNRKIKDRTIFSYLIATVLSSVVKFCILYFTIAKFLVPIILNIPQTQASIISASFSTVQILNSAIGGIVAVLFLPLMKKALRGKIYE